MDRKLGHWIKYERDRLEAFKMWYWRNMENISWQDHKTNEFVLDLVKENRKLLNTVLERKKRWLGHILRESCERSYWRTDGRKERYKKYESRVSSSCTTSRPIKHMIWKSVELWKGNVEETWCLEPALEQNTNDDDGHDNP